MNIFSRLSDIISANLNALLDRAENPEVMIAHIIREMEEGLARARRLGASAVAAEKRIGRELEQKRQQAELWRNKARSAIDRGREDLARRALERCLDHEN